MDIEGAELHALEGSRRTIGSAWPKLAICIYHSDEDRIDIPVLIHRNFPEYSLYIR